MQEKRNDLPSAGAAAPGAPIASPGYPPFKCGECGETVDARALHDYTSCVAYRVKTVYQDGSPQIYGSVREMIVKDFGSLIYRIRELEKQLRG